ncbi:MAG: 30S ribosomal protein S2 [Coriobacteriia bacterium]|nr:30S ribosomal protein S2 [Coriobacteriia bacterium]
MATKVNVASLIDAGVHFGHQTRRWNPKMKPYIFTSRKGIYIIDLKQTLLEMDKAYSFVKNLAEKKGIILFVGTKKQAQEPIKSAAERCGMPYVNHRWLGGMLTNFVTIRSRVTYMEELEAMEEDGRMAALPKKEQVLLRKKLDKLQASLNGVRHMVAAPQAVFIVDTKREEIAVAEATKLKVPVIGILDTNADPDEVSFGIPGNDDAIRSVGLIANCMADAVIAGGNAESITVEELMSAPVSSAPAKDAVADDALTDTKTATQEQSTEDTEAIDEPVEAAEVVDETLEVPEADEALEAAPDAESSLEEEQAAADTDDASSEIAKEEAEASVKDEDE